MNFLLTYFYVCLQTALCLAVITNQPLLVERLLQLGSDVTTQIITDAGPQMPSKHEQPLHFAARKGVPWLNMLRVLLRSQHVDIDVFNSDGLLPTCCFYTHVTRIQGGQEKQRDSTYSGSINANSS